MTKEDIAQYVNATKSLADEIGAERVRHNLEQRQGPRVTDPNPWSVTGVLAALAGEGIGEEGMMWKGPRWRAQLLKVGAAVLDALVAYDLAESKRDPLDKFRKDCQRMADECGEVVLLFRNGVKGPNGEGLRLTCSQLLSQSSRDEIAKADERFEPRKLPTVGEVTGRIQFSPIKT